MEDRLDKLFLDIRYNIFDLIGDKQIDLNALAFDLGISRKEFINNFSKRIDDFTFYLQALSLVVSWEE